MIYEIDWMVGDEHRKQLAPLLDVAFTLAPDWLHTLSVRYNPDIGDIASIKVMYEYRSAHLHIGNAWFSETPQEQKATLVHEIIHIPLAPMAANANMLIEATTEEKSPLREWAEKQLSMAEESCVSDLSRKLAILLWPA